MKPFAVIIALASVALVSCSKPVAGPPLGWNSYDSYGVYLYEEAAMENAEQMARLLKPSGYEFFVIDAGWFCEYNFFPGTHYVPDKRFAPMTFNEYGVLQPSQACFPNGFKPLIDKVHSLGLKFGLHLMRGISREAVRQNVPIKGTPYHAADIADTTSICVWNSQNYGVDMTKPGAQEFYNSVVDQLAEWGVDFVKYDDIVPFPREVEAVQKAIARCGRKIVLSLSPGDWVDMTAVDVYSGADMLRVTGDVWDEQKDIDKCFSAWRKWQGRSFDRLWIDMDMIPFGYLQLLAPDPSSFPEGVIEGLDGMTEKAKDKIFSGRGFTRWCQLSHDQMYTFITMRAMSASPLMVGGDLLTLDDFSLKLLTDREMLACNQNGVIGTLQCEKDGIEVWRTDAKKGRGGWIGVFNRTDAPVENLSLTNADAGLREKNYIFRDIWNACVFKMGDNFSLAPHGVLFLRYK